MMKTYLLIITLLTIIISSIGLIISMKTNNLKEKNSPYECGFDYLSSSRSMFSIQFFIITIIFIIFDVEISIILPFTIIFKWIIYWKFMIIFSIIFILLSLGLLYEWMKGALTWMK